MNNPFWRPTDEQREAILLLEALGLVHDLGKFCDRFLQSQEPSSTIDYVHSLLADPHQVGIYQNHIAISGDAATESVQGWLADAANASKFAAFGERADMTDVFKAVQFIDWSGETYNFAELAPLIARPGLARTTANWQGVLGKAMQPGLLIGKLHGPAHIEKEGEPDLHKQAYSDVFRATPFGLEEQIKTGTVQELTDALQILPLSDIRKITSERREAWLTKMQTRMKQGLADNRRPHNEVSLWDWGFIVAAMTKAAAAWIFKNGWSANLDNLPFRTLRVSLDRLERYTHSDKISDLLGVRAALDDAFSQVQTLLEATYTLSNRLYHDETGAYYLFPDLGYSDEELAALRQEIQAFFPPDLLPQVHLGKSVTVGALDHDKTLSRELVAEPRKQALQERAVRADNNFYPFNAEWSEDHRPKNAEICTVCGMRPVGYPRKGTDPEVEKALAYWADQDKAEQRNICRVCLDRRGRRAEKWVKEELHTTIWTDEVADDNGRLALLVGQLGLDGWLDGSLLDTIQVTSNTTKTPSPVRLYRIAETARAFWEQVRDGLTPSTIGQRPFRLALYPQHNDIPDLGDFHAYELDVDGLALSVVWDKPNKRFLTAENLGYFVRRWKPNSSEPLKDLRERLQGQTFNVLEPSEFERPGQRLLSVLVERLETLDGYQPTIPLLTEPGVCMLLVPADKALELAYAVKREYEKQMGKVRDRLPLHLGLIFCPRRTPIRAVLEAGRSMLDMAGQDVKTEKGWEGWRLKGKNSPNPAQCELVFDNGITWQISILTGDCKVEDQWYPRLYEGDNWGHEQTKPKHVRDLRVRNPNMPPDKGWKVWVRPSRFDFEFLDTTARRFEIHYGTDGRRPGRRTRPFYLEDLDRLKELWRYMEKGLTKTQRHQVVRTIEATRETWYGQDENDTSTTDGVFEQFVRDTLAGATWKDGYAWSKIPEDWQDKLVRAGVSGELTDLAELHMEILKE